MMRRASSVGKAALLAALLAAGGAALAAPTGSAAPDASTAPATPGSSTAPAAAKPSDADLQAYAKLPVCTLSADGQHLAVEPCRTAPARKPMPRRPVTQFIQRMPVAPPPRVATAPPLPASPSLQQLLQPPRSPIPVAGCDAGGCYDPSGVRHNNAGSAIAITPSGKLCTRNGIWLQCQ